MPTVFSRTFHLYHLLMSLLFPLIPKTRDLCHFSPASETSKTLQQNYQETKESPSPLSSQPRSTVNMDPAELRRVFQMFDRNGDGRVTKQELTDKLQNLGIFIADNELMSMIEKIDVNGDGCVDIDEFGELYQQIMDEKDEEEDMREAFNVFDQNGDGFITVEELRSVLASLGLKQGRTIEDCKKMIRKVDVDGDGMVNYKEFRQMMRGGGFAALSSS
ncbi:hypothetical protein AAC387_Pa02g0159 [Persea americana]